MPHKIKSFTDLECWRQAHLLVLEIYEITKAFPASETYCLIDQMRRCSISISSNIAEGFSRQSKKEKLKFYFISKGSLGELQNQLLISKDIGYIKELDYHGILNKLESVHKLLNGLIRTTPDY